jgi:sugar (pentulose or hexulose) kinase
MASTPVIVVFDIGKTNKKVFVFDASYRILHEHTDHLPETSDDDGFPCEDIELLSRWVLTQWKALLQDTRWSVKAVNVSAYGASFVNLGSDGRPITPLYNYLKPLPPQTRDAFRRSYPEIWTSTASPDLDNLNSGIQLFMIKRDKPDLFARIAVSLHLPQYISCLLTGRAFSELTSVGCHTAMWDFTTMGYHRWINAEGLTGRQAELVPSNTVVEIRTEKDNIYSGIGLHDSSAALIPYLATQADPFCLLSTGTWSIALNPFNHSPLTAQELAQDCLCYLSYQGTPVKASRLFSGHFHDEQVKLLAAHFNKREHYYKSISEDALSQHVATKPARNLDLTFTPFEPSDFTNYEAAYVFLMEELITRQIKSTRMVLSEGVRKIFVDGGFSHNPLFMRLLAKAFPGYKVFAASVAQASALGAALAIRDSWKSAPFGSDLLKLRKY